MSLSEFDNIKELGKGAFATVSLVKRKSDNSEYAMKRVKISSLKKKEKENALNEIRILASISSPYIIGYKEAFFDEESQTLNIVMEYAGKGDIEAKIKLCQKTKQYINENIIWSYFIQILKGLKCLHDNYIMHRDLKSANIFIGEDNCIKIGDLNVSKILKNDAMALTQTGTPYYASPEVWSDKPYDYKSDIWSVGCIIYEMCTLKPPFRAKSIKELFNSVTKGVYEPIPDFYSKELETIISTLLQISPNKRPDCYQILNLEYVQSKIKELRGNTIESSRNEDEVILINTIKLPKDMIEINKKLPKNYSLPLTNNTSHTINIDSDLTENKDIKFNYKNIITKKYIQKSSENNIDLKSKLRNINNKVNYSKQINTSISNQISNNNIILPLDNNNYNPNSNKQVDYSKEKVQLILEKNRSNIKNYNINVKQNSKNMLNNPNNSKNINNSNNEKIINVSRSKTPNSVLLNNRILSTKVQNSNSSNNNKKNSNAQNRPNSAKISTDNSLQTRNIQNILDLKKCKKQPQDQITNCVENNYIKGRAISAQHLKYVSNIKPNNKIFSKQSSIDKQNIIHTNNDSKVQKSPVKLIPNSKNIKIIGSNQKESANKNLRSGTNLQVKNKFLLNYHNPIPINHNALPCSGGKNAGNKYKLNLINKLKK